MTIDGNENLTRAMCAAPKEKINCPVNQVNLVQCCTRSPVKGGQHQRSSKFCQSHEPLANTATTLTEPTVLTVQIPLQLITIQKPATDTSPLVGTLPDNDSSELLTVGRKNSKVNKFFDRTAGVIAVVRPCGIVVNIIEMYTCMSPTQMYILLCFTFGHGRDIGSYKYVAYDRSL